jgi:hypothetical protein
VLFSCKITHSILLSLDRRGEDLGQVYESCDWPSEFLHDPSSWLEADKMEKLLANLEKQFGFRQSLEQSLITEVGHQCKDLRAWGVLDSVLRMVQAPKDFFAQPDRFLSYFISPAPPIGEVRREHDSVSFVLPISEDDFPVVTSYLCSVLEALPTYIGKPMASVSWKDSRVTITWTESQESLLFTEQEKAELSLHPELVNSILNNLETSQKELEETKQKLLAREAELDVMRLVQAVPLRIGSSPGDLTRETVATALHEIYRLGDYFARGQQLVTLLIAQGRESAQVREAMRRVDWPFVCESAPAVIRTAISQLQTAQMHLKNLPEGLTVSDSKDVGASQSPLQPSLFATPRVYP